jgi:hypothetical protein
MPFNLTKMDLIDFQNNLLTIDVWVLLTPILERHFGELENLNRKQLSEGVMSDGSPMVDYADIGYADFKDKHIPTYKIFPTTDLRYTGDFYDAIKANIDLFGISVESFDSKARLLESKYSSEIYGLTEESLIIFTKSVIDEFTTALRNAILK